jgi:hypothetical protein
MREADTTIMNFVGTPEGWMRVGFVSEDGTPVIAMVQMAPDWRVEVHVDDATGTAFCVGVSLDRQQVVAERWVGGHAPRRMECVNPIEQRAAMGGLDASTLDHAGIVAALRDDLTNGDNPLPVPPRTLDLVRVDDTHTTGMERRDLDRHGDLYYSNHRGKPVWWFPYEGRLRALRTMSEVSDTRYVYRNGQEIFFLFEIGDDYLLEHVRPWKGNLQRRHVRVAQESVVATNPPDIIAELDPQLAYDPIAFSGG